MDSSERVNYKSVVRLLKKKYPSIYEELALEPVLNDLTMVEPLLGRFCLLKGLTRAEFVKNKENCRLQFLAVVTKVFDPSFFVDDDKKLLSGLREIISALAFTQGSQISYNLKTVRTYLRSYPSFKREVDYLYATIVKEFSYEECKYQNNLHGGRKSHPIPAEP